MAFGNGILNQPTDVLFFCTMTRSRLVVSTG
jgi:hypothetical protein